MSTDGTQPPASSPPRRPASGGGRVGTADAATRQPRGPVTDRGAEPARRPAEEGDASTTSRDEDSGTGSVGDRLKRAAHGAAGAARSALPAAGHSDAPPARDDQPTRDWSRPARPEGRPATSPTGPVPAGAGRPTAERRPPERPAAERPAPQAAAPAGPRRVRLAVARIDPWSVMKLAFLLSVAIGIMIVVAAAVVWYTLDSLHVFTQINDVIATLAGSETFFNLLEFTSFERVIALATMIAVVDVVLLTALSTIGAFLYNIVAALVGGIHVTLTDD